MGSVLRFRITEDRIFLLIVVWNRFLVESTSSAAGYAGRRRAMCAKQHCINTVYNGKVLTLENIFRCIFVVYF